jgi:hypothetical protein
MESRVSCRVHSVIWWKYHEWWTGHYLEGEAGHDVNLFEAQSLHSPGQYWEKRRNRSHGIECKSVEVRIGYLHSTYKSRMLHLHEIRITLFLLLGVRTVVVTPWSFVPIYLRTSLPDCTVSHPRRPYLDIHLHETLNSLHNHVAVLRHVTYEVDSIGAGVVQLLLRNE